MTALKILFLILIIIPFVIFLIFIMDKLMNELPKRSEIDAHEAEEIRKRREAAKNDGQKNETHKVQRKHTKTTSSKRKRRRERKKKKKEQ